MMDYITILNELNEVIISFYGQFSLENVITDNKYSVIISKEEPIFTDDDGIIKYYPEQQNKANYDKS